MQLRDGMPRTGETRQQRAIARAAGTLRKLAHNRRAVVALLDEDILSIGFPASVGGSASSTIHTNATPDLTARAALSPDPVASRAERTRRDIDRVEAELLDALQRLDRLYATVPLDNVRVWLEKSRAQCWAGRGLAGYEEWGTPDEECFELTAVSERWVTEHGGYACRKHKDRYMRWLNDPARNRQGVR